MRLTRNRLIVCLAVAGGLFGHSLAWAQSTNLSTPEFHEKLTGTMITVLLHETAHALIDILDPVVTGPEEDVADEFATMLLLEEAKRGNADANVMVQAYASTFLGLWERYTAYLEREQQGNENKQIYDFIPLRWFLDEHSFEVKRAVNTLCLFYGADPTIDTARLIESKLPVDENWKRRCLNDYERKRDVWQRVLDPFRPPDVESGIDLPESLVDPDPEDVILFPNNPVTDRPSFTLKFLPTTAEVWRYYDIDNLVSSPYRKSLALVGGQVTLPFDVPVFAGTCGSPDAFYSVDDKQILICHEFVDLIADDIVRYETGLDFETWWQRQRTHETPARLVGLWRSVDPVRGTATDIELNDNGLGDIGLYDLIEGEVRPTEATAAFATYWGVGRPGFDTEGEWIWHLDAEIGGFFWSQVEALSETELGLGSFQAGIYQRVR